MMPDFEVSVIMPVYNEEKYLEETIESLLSQSFRNFEFIIVDDCSTDRSPDVLQEYSGKDDRIKVFFNDYNRGWAATINRGIKLSETNYIALMDAGDVCHPERLEKQIDFLKNNDKVFVVGSFHDWIDENGEVIGKYGFPVHPEDIREKVFGLASITVCPSLMIKKEVFREIGLFNTKLPKAADYDFFVRAIVNGFNFANIPKFFLSVRKRRGRGTLENLKTTFDKMAKIRARYLPRLFNTKNLFYTLLSFMIANLPSPALKRIMGMSIEKGSIRKSLLSL